MCIIKVIISIIIIIIIIIINEVNYTKVKTKLNMKYKEKGFNTLLPSTLILSQLTAVSR